jgi:ABC-type polysaccharide/polyol phosphate export permease
MMREFTPPPELLVRAHIRPIHSVRKLWAARELVRTVAERDFRARYKQAVLGVSWAILTPLVYMGAFTVVFQRVADVDTGGVPYALFSIVGLLPWTFFSTSLNRGATSLISNRALLNKVSFPREVFPLGSVLVAGVDMLLATSAAVLLFVWHGTMPEPTSYWIPVILAVQVLFALGVSLLASILVVFLRDLLYVIPMLLQVGLFLTPVGYPLDSVSADMRPLYSFFNPLAAVIDSYRRTVLYGESPRLGLLALGAAGALVYVVVGFVAFRRLEGDVADVG